MTPDERRRLFWMGLLLCMGGASAAEVRNVAAYQQADRMVVTYDLDDDTPGNAAGCDSDRRPELCRDLLGPFVAAQFAIEGRLHSHESLRIVGDIGHVVAPGKGRRFSWNVLQDYPQGLTTEVLLSVTAAPRKRRESDVASLGDQQAEIFRRIDAEGIAVAESNRSLVFGPAARVLASRIDEKIRTAYALAPDEALLEKSRYYCARFSAGNVAPGELDVQWERKKSAPPPPVADGAHDRYFSCLLSSLDPHSDYLTPDAYRDLQQVTKGEFGGVGIELAIRNGMPVVASVIDDTPAFRAGILGGDHVLEIDGKPTAGMLLRDMGKLLRGQKGTSITLTFRRPANAAVASALLVRDVISVPSVRYRSLASGYGYVRIAQFQERTADDVGNALESLRAAGGGSLTGLVLDLRNDPGGLLNSAIAVASRFIDSGPIVSTRGRDQASSRQFSALAIGKEPPYRIAVLVNGASASAAEIVAGALQDHRRAVVIGAPSFGKGSVQTVMAIGEDAIKLTTSIYYTPNGRSIHLTGIVPDIPLDQDGAVDEGAIAFALRVLREPSTTRDIVSRKDLLEQMKIEEFFSLYRNAVRTRLEVALPAATATKPSLPGVARPP